MKITKAKRVLDKISHLIKNMEMDDHISNIERDLMLSYAKEFYDCFDDKNIVTKMAETKLITHLEKEPIIQKKVVVEKIIAPIPEPEPIPEPTVHVNEIEEEEEEEEEIEEIKEDVSAIEEKIESIAEEAPKQINDMFSSVPSKPKMVKIPNSVQEYLSDKSQINDRFSTINNTVKKVKPEINLPKVEVTPIQEKIVANSHSAAIFEHSNNSDLSEKLATSPIKNIKQSMGINEKILTINELFDGDHKLFDSTLEKLNKFSNFDEAKHFLAENIAEKYNWAAPTKEKKARIFIKYVKRLYP